jgi:hypothetical protein
MTQQEERLGAEAGRTVEFVAEGRHRLKDFAGAQTQFWDRLQDSNRKWLDRVQIEANLAAEFANKLGSAKSLVDTANILQSWTVKHMEMATEDARRMLTDTQEIFTAGARLWSNLGGDGRSRGH